MGPVERMVRRRHKESLKDAFLTQRSEEIEFNSVLHFLMNSKDARAKPNIFGLQC